MSRPATKVHYVTPPTANGLAYSQLNFIRRVHHLAPFSKHSDFKSICENSVGDMVGGKFVPTQIKAGDTIALSSIQGRGYKANSLVVLLYSDNPSLQSSAPQYKISYKPPTVPDDPTIKSGGKMVVEHNPSYAKLSRPGCISAILLRDKPFAIYNLDTGRIGIAIKKEGESNYTIYIPKFEFQKVYDTSLELELHLRKRYDHNPESEYELEYPLEIVENKTLTAPVVSTLQCDRVGDDLTVTLLQQPHLVSSCLTQAELQHKQALHPVITQEAFSSEPEAVYWTDYERDREAIRSSSSEKEKALEAIKRENKSLTTTLKKGIQRIIKFLDPSKFTGIKKY